jgi:hypothetical protein
MNSITRETQAADARQYGAMMVLCPACRTTIGDADVSETGGVLWHLACTADLARFPREYWLRIEDDVAEAVRPFTGLVTREGRESRTVVRKGVLSEYHAIAAEADAAAHEAFMSRTTGDVLDCEDDAKAARAAVWARRMAERGAPPGPVWPAEGAEGISGRWQLGPLGRRVLTFTSDEGAAMGLDALVRYLADKPVETLRAVVRLVRTLPVGLGPQLNIGSCTEGGHALVAALPGARTGRSTTGPTALGPSRPLAYAIAEIDGVEICARFSPEEPAR